MPNTYLDKAIEAYLYSLTFSGAEKEAKRHPPPTKPPPIWGVLTENRGYPSIHQGFGMAREACALRASHGVFIGWRTVNNLDLQSRLLTLNRLKANFCLYSLNRSLNNLYHC